MMSDIKAQAKSSRNTKLHTLGGKGSVGKSYDTGAGHTFNGEAGLNSDHIQDEQRIKTRKDGGRVGGTKMKPRLDRKAKMNDHDEDDGYNRGGRVAKASGGKVSGKGKTNITIVMAPGGQGASQAPQAVPVPRPIPVPIQAPPPGAAPPMGAGAPPMPMPPPAAGPMGRKKGGRVNKAYGGRTPDQNNHSDLRTRPDGSTPRTKYDDVPPGTEFDDDETEHRKRGGRAKHAAGGKVTVGKGLGLTAGAGGGEGRLEKIKVQKRTYP